MKQLLSYKLPVDIDAYSGVAGNVAALMCVENGEDVILKNHFLITYSRMLHAPGFNWLYYDDGFKIQDDIQDWIDEGDFIYKVKQCIGQGYYVHLYLNHFLSDVRIRIIELISFMIVQQYLAMMTSVFWLEIIFIMGNIK